MYQPILYSQNVPHNDSDPSFKPEAIYYRIIFEPTQAEYCIQYYFYWLDQNCSSFLGISNHKYDYEPIYVYFHPSEISPIGVVNSGESKVLGLNQCRFHKTEARKKEYSIRDQVEESCTFRTSPAPYYPFGGSEGIEGKNCAKRYPLAGSIYFSDVRPMFGVATCFHAFSGAENSLNGGLIEPSLKQLNDEILHEWYMNHYNDRLEEPFGHDVSNPFEFPFIKYVDVKEFLEG